MAKTTNNAKSGISFKQGLQLFFVHKILDERYTMGSEVGSRRGIAFFSQWSQIVRAGTARDKSFPVTIEVPADLGKPLVKEILDKGDGIVEASARPGTSKAGRLDLSFVPKQFREDYRALLQDSRFNGLWHLLCDEDLGRLMQIPYPAEITEITAVVGTSKEADIVREAMARQLKKRPDDLTAEDYHNINELNLSGSQISELEPVRGLTSLQVLYLSGTRVSDLEPIRGLTSLRGLYLDHTQVRDLEPIKGLTSLQVLYLSGTQVSDLEPIRGLTSLQELYLNSTRVSDLEPIRGLTSLQGLDLSVTQISNLEPIRGLISLQVLGLYNTQVSDEQVGQLKEALPELEIHR
jgi:hypothetical protein